MIKALALKPVSADAFKPGVIDSLKPVTAETKKVEEVLTNFRLRYNGRR